MHPGSSGETIHAVFEDQVGRTPEAIALVFGDRALRYAELDAQANQVAARLRLRYAEHTGGSLEADTPVAVLLERGVEMIVGILAILKAGGAYLPVDPTLPSARLRYVLADARAQVVLSTAKVLDERRPHDEFAGLLVLDMLAAGHAPANQPPAVVAGDALAYVMYTSGTTGKPKGVMIEHRSVVNLARAMRDELRLAPCSVMLQMSPLSFDASVCEIFSTLVSGAKLVIADDESRHDPLVLMELIRSQSVTTAVMLPSLLARASMVHAPAVPSLTTLVVAGEACTRDVMRNWGVGRRLINGYGPTEGTVCATSHVFQGDEQPTILGKPIANVQIHVLDERREPVPVGATGELYISGRGLARGYLHDPDRTRERFLANPFADAAGRAAGFAKLYKTGDLVRRSSPNTLEYVGRNDFQVKIRGHRIELGEVEGALLDFPGVKQVCVVARAQRLVVYYVAEHEFEAASFTQHLGQSLPEYMVPSCFVWLTSLPLTHNGKVDRLALPDPTDSPLGARPRAPVAPRTPRERELSVLWQELLGTDRVGVEDDFFTVGGDSFLAISLASMISDRLGITTKVAMIYEHTTIAKQALVLEARGSQAAALTPLIQFRAGSERVPLFIVHPSMTGARIYEPMLAWLPDDQPFYGVESYNCNHLDALETDLRALARRYVSHIRAVQARGPYLLAGYSAGGSIAYEICHQLLDAGESIKRLYLIDSLLPDPSVRAAGVSTQDAADFLDYFKLTNSTNEQLLRLARAEMALLFGYEPRAKLEAQAVLIKATKPLTPLDTLRPDHIARYLFSLETRTSGWERHIREVEPYPIDADHETIMQVPKLERVTQIIRADLDRWR